MKKYLIFAMFLVLAVALVSPVSVSAKTKAGTKSGSFFYFFDKAFERADLFFTFNSEKKAKKVLENADERLAEAEESANENKPEAVETAMKDYQENIEVLEKVLEKVPEQAKEAIEKAIEADKERQEGITKKIEEINNEKEEKINEIKKEESEFKNSKDEKLKSNDDVGDNKNGKEEVENENKDENKKDEQKKEIEKLKKEVEGLKQKQPQIKIIEKIIEKEKPITIEKKESSSSQTNSQTKQNENIVTLPNGAVVEMDVSGNVVRTIKEVEATPQASTFKHVIVNAPQYVSREIKKGETNVSFISLRLQSVGDTPVRVESANVRIVGPANAIKIMKIANCNIPQPLNDKGEATLVCPLSIKNGSSNNYNIIADISDDISSENGKTIQVSVESIKAEDAVISGEFPIVSASHKIIAPPSLPKVAVSSGRGNDQPRKIGTKNYVFSGIKISTDKKVFIQSIKWNMSGSGSLSKLENLKTYVNDVSYEGSISDDGRYLTSVFNGITFNAGETKEIYIKGDIVGDVGKWLSFDIFKDVDIVITDENGNIIIPKAEQLWNYENSGGFRSVNPWYDGYLVEVAQ